jgi:hypothetical protein
VQKGVEGEGSNNPIQRAAYLYKERNAAPG